METIPWYKAAIIRQQLVLFGVGLIAMLKMLGVPGVEDIDVEGIVGTVLAAIALLVPVYTIVTRLFKPTPPITPTAVAKTQELEAKQATARAEVERRVP